MERFASDASCQPDNEYEEREAAYAMKIAFGALSLYEKKVLRLKGLSI
jgi:hypothetical protein